MIPLQAILDAWQTFFHAPELPTTVAVFRVLFGLLQVLDTLLLFRDARRFLGPGGVLSAESYRKSYGRSRFTILAWLPQTDSAVRSVLIAQLIAALLLTVGLATRLSAAVVWATLVSIHHRNPAICNAGDSLKRLLAFLLVFAEAGSAFSVDAWLAGLPAEGQLCSPWCLRLMQLQVAIVYLRTVFWKLRGRLWIAGTAAYYPTQLLNYRRVELPNWALGRLCVAVATWGTLVIEVALGLLVWIRELRYPVLAAGAALHLGLEVVLNLQLFGLIMVACLVLFVGPDDLHGAMAWVSQLLPR